MRFQTGIGTASEPHRTTVLLGIRTAGIGTAKTAGIGTAGTAIEKSRNRPCLLSNTYQGWIKNVRLFWSILKVKYDYELLDGSLEGPVCFRFLDQFDVEQKLIKITPPPHKKSTSITTSTQLLLK